MSAYYNENDPKAAAWLRELIKAGLIAPGDVDERSIWDVTPADVMGYRQAHWFGGIGVWSYALRCAGWSDDRPAWTGSCPCQPFSSAGKGGGFADERHLWPAWFWLISQCRPVVCFGEQVASRGGLAWFDLVSADLEGAGYAIGAVDTCAAGFGAPHKRQRLYFVADSERGSPERHGHKVGDAPGGVQGAPWEQRLRVDAGNCESIGVVGDTCGEGLEGRRIGRDGANEWTTRETGMGSEPGPTNGFWADAEWIPCRDGKARPTKPGIFPLAHGAPERVGRLRGYGNAIVAPQAEAFVRAYIDTR